MWHTHHLPHFTHTQRNKCNGGGGYAADWNLLQVAWIGSGQRPCSTWLVQSPCAPYYRAPAQSENLFLRQLCTQRRACLGSQKTQRSGPPPLHGCPFEWFVTCTGQISIIVCVGLVSLCFWDSSLSPGLTPLHPFVSALYLPSLFQLTNSRSSFMGLFVGENKSTVVRTG